MLSTKEHYDLMSFFEKSYAGSRLDKEDKTLWPKGAIYQDGYVNNLFLAFRSGYMYSQAEMRT